MTKAAATECARRQNNTWRYSFPSSQAMSLEPLPGTALSFIMRVCEGGNACTGGGVCKEKL